MVDTTKGPLCPLQEDSLSPHLRLAFPLPFETSLMSIDNVLLLNEKASQLLGAEHGFREILDLKSIDIFIRNMYSTYEYVGDDIQL